MEWLFGTKLRALTTYIAGVIISSVAATILGAVFAVSLVALFALSVAGVQYLSKKPVYSVFRS